MNIVWHITAYQGINARYDKRHIFCVLKTWRRLTRTKSVSDGQAQNNINHDYCQDNKNSIVIYHVGDGNSVLWHDECDVKGCLDGWLIPAGERAPGVGRLNIHATSKVQHAQSHQIRGRV